jgi:hypothetical protein
MTKHMETVTENYSFSKRAVSKSLGVGGINSYQLGKTNQLGFHDLSGKRGVTGVIVHDYMNGVINEPHRYNATMTISPEKAPRNEINLKRESHLPPKCTALLKFTEYVMLQQCPSLEIEFQMSSFKELSQHIKKKYSEARFQTMQAKAKVNSLLKLVSSKNSALYSLLEKPSLQKGSKKMLPRADEDIRYGYQCWDLKMPSPELASPLHAQLIPQRQIVAPMKIPIYAPTKPPKKANNIRYGHKERDPWLKLDKDDRSKKSTQKIIPQFDSQKQSTSVSR